MIKEITGIILCGGKSTRMQGNKAFLKIGELTIVEIMAAKLMSVFSDVVISANNKNDYSFLDLHIIQDDFIDKGPLSGIHAAIKSTETEKNFIISCDMPLISKEMIEFIVNYDSESQIILPKTAGQIQYLCGVYSKSVVKEIENIFTLTETDKNIKGSIFDLLERVPVEFVDVDRLPFYKKDIFLNMNTKEDYELIKNIYEKK